MYRTELKVFFTGGDEHPAEDHMARGGDRKTARLSDVNQTEGTLKSVCGAGESKKQTNKKTHPTKDFKATISND